MKLFPEELSEFPCPFSIETDCDNNCDNSENTKNIEEGKINKDKIGRIAKEGLITKVRKPETERGERKEEGKGTTPQLNRQIHHLAKTPLAVAHSITKPILLDLASCQCDSLEKAHSLHLVTPEGRSNQVEEGNTEVLHLHPKVTNLSAEASHPYSEASSLYLASKTSTAVSGQFTEALCAAAQALSIALNLYAAMYMETSFLLNLLNQMQLVQVLDESSRTTTEHQQ